MTRKLWSVLVLSLFFVAFLAVTSFGLSSPTGKKSQAVPVDQMPRFKLAGTERAVDYVAPPPGQGQSLGFEGAMGASPGMIVGFSTYDYQHNGRMGRQVDWRGTEMVHFDWMKETDSTLGGNRGTGYEAWDEELTGFVLNNSPGGGCDVHPRLGSGVNYSGYVTLDVDTEGKVVICNHHEEGAGWASTVWYDFAPAACFFSPYRSRIPDSIQNQHAIEGDPEQIWPSMDYQVWDGDTVTHVFSQQGNTSGDGTIVYFRRLGSDTVGHWEDPPWCVDTVSVLAQTVTSSRVSGKVALVWNGNLPEVPGDGESATGGSQVLNDVYYTISPDMGANWGTTPGVMDKFNITKSDPSQAGWRAYCDISCLIGTDDALHVIWDAREYSPDPPPSGSFPHPNGCRLFHYDQINDEVRVVKDANWDVPTQGSCTGGAWNNMSITKMSISECNGKFYSMFVQHQAIDEGIYNDCHDDAFTAGATSGTSNGELYISVSDNGGYNWDIARNLTNTRTPGCDHEEAYVCDADNWPSMARFGMQVTYGDFSGVPTVDPSGEYTGDYWLDVFYVNDVHPSACVQNQGIWTYNPLKWFRVACVNPVPNPVLAITPGSIDDPVWTKPSTPLQDTIKLENIGNAPLNIDSIVVVEITGSGWLAVGAYPSTISHLSPNFYDMEVTLNAGGSITVGPFLAEGTLDIYGDQAGGTVHYSVKLIVADTLQFPKAVDIRTECTRLLFNNAGNMGNGGNPPDGGYNLGFFDDCDTTNGSGANDNAPVYIYDGSPFLLRVDDADDTVLTYSMFDSDWLSEDGFRPLEGPYVDSVTYDDYQYGYSGKFANRDTSLIVEVEYYAPKQADSCEFIVMKQRVYNNTTSTISGVYVGDMFDWDIPSDTTVRNLSGFDAVGGEASRDLMYCQGWEASPDTLDNGDPDTVNDCVLADERLAGMAFYNGFKLPYKGADDSLENPAGPWWTALNADYVYPSGGFVAEEIWRKIAAVGSGFEAWSSDDPDSVAYDLHMVAVMGQFDIGENDTLVFVKVLVTENGQTKGLANLKETVDRARQWIELRPEIFAWPEVTGCCDTPGDANNSGGVNILDVTRIINYLYKGGAPPPCMDEGDANGSNSINILDVTRIINYLYKGGAAPVCGTTGS